MTLETKKERAFGLLEKYQVSKQLTKAYGNVTMTACLEHENMSNIDFHKAFQPALKTVVQNHPTLSMIVRDVSNSDVHFERLVKMNLDQVIQVSSESMTLNELIKEQTDLEFDLDSNLPLWRLKVIRLDNNNNNNNSCLVTFAAHHVIVDGMSLTIFWNDFLSELNKPSQEIDSIIETGSKPLSLPYELSGAPELSLFKNILPIVFKELVAPKILPSFLNPFQKKEGWQGDYKAVEGEGHDTVTSTIHIPNEVWKPIMIKSKEQGISAHAILFITCLAAWAKLYPDQLTEATTPINCRPMCNPPVCKNEIGNYTSAYTSHWQAHEFQQDNLWTLAKKYYIDLNQNKTEAAKESLLLKFLSEFPASYNEFWYNKRKNSKLGRTGGFELSDLGKHHIQQDGEWKLKAAYFCQSAQIFTSALNVNSFSCNDNLYCTLSWQKGSLDDTKMNKYNDIFTQILMSLIK